ncbi:MAG TPA: EAL domain-containing protein [Gammaproteobacteria bacterium]
MMNTFQARLAIVFVALTAGALLVTFLAVSVTTRADVIDTAQEEIRVGQRVVEQLLNERVRQLVDSANVLADDFGFRGAVATGDVPTMRSALTNHSRRIGADAALILDLDGKVLAATATDAATTFPYSDLLARAERDGSAATVALLGERVYQLVLVPVHAPLRVAWVALAFELDESFAESLQRLTGLEVTLASPGVSTFVANSTLDRDVSEALASQAASIVAAAGSVSEFTADDDTFLTLPFAMDETALAPVYALLQIPLDAALQPYRELQLQLLAIAGIALFATLAGAIVIANSVAQPVRDLVAVAGRISLGDYSFRTPSKRKDELGKLADAFNHMQAGIAEREKKIVFQAQHDTLTGLPNRVLANDRLAQAIARVRRTGDSVAVLVLDMDRFKEINDTLGHAVGDDVLRTVATRLAQDLRASDTIARLGGDEFLVILDGADNNAAIAKAREISERLSQPIQVHNSRLQVSISIGIALCPAHGLDAETLLRRADIAMYDAKQTREPVSMYEDGYDERYLHRLSLIADLKSAVENDEFFLEFQPKVDLDSGEVHHVEALVRWQHPRFGRMAPDSFIPLAEQSGHISLVTNWVIDNGLDNLRRWLDQGADIALSINLSALDLIDTNLPERITAGLEARNIDPERLVVEITESAVMRDAEFAITMLNRLRDCGIRLSIDDFGTGYSSLAQLKRLPVHNLKIDKSFVIGLKAGSEDAMIVKSTIDLGHNMGLRVIAEGVEAEETRDILKGYSCDLAQGYLFSRPLSADAFLKWYRDQRNKEKA